MDPIKSGEENIINLPIENEIQVANKIIKLKQLEKNIENKYADMLENYKKIQAEKKEIDLEIELQMNLAKEKAISLNMKGVIVKKIKSPEYDEEKLLSNPKSNLWSKKILDKIALKNYVKENGEVDGFSEVEKTTFSVNVENLIVEYQNELLENK